MPSVRNFSLEKNLNRSIELKNNVWVFGDVHGFSEALGRLIQGVSLGRDDRIILLGDMIDRGPQSKEVVEIVRSDYRIFSLLGNHEDLFLKCLDLNKLIVSPTKKWLKSGGRDTLKSYGIECEGIVNIDRESKIVSDAEWMSNLPYEIVLDKWRLVHAGYNPSRPLDKQKPEELLWLREKFFNHQNIIDSRRTIVVGHTVPSSFGFNDGEVATSEILLEDGRPAWININTSMYGWFPGALSAFNLTTGDIVKCNSKMDIEINKLVK
jgi:serine/threonine protein phosphatase 1